MSAELGELVAEMRGFVNATTEKTPLAEIRNRLKTRADNEYCRGLSLARQTLCLGVNYKIEHGTFGHDELTAHINMRCADAWHRALYWAISVIDAAEKQP